MSGVQLPAPGIAEVIPGGHVGLGGGGLWSTFLRRTRLWGHGCHTSSWTCWVDGWLLENRFSEAQSVGWAGRPQGASAGTGRGSVPSRWGAAPLPELQRSSQGSPALPLPWAGPQATRPSPGPFLGSWGGEETKPWWEGRATWTWSRLRFSWALRPGD